MDKKPIKIDTISLSFLGTAEHRDYVEHAITTYHRAITNTGGNVAARLFDGPGSFPAHPDSGHPTPGTYIYDPNTNTKKISDNAVLRAIDNTLVGLTGQLAGEGVDNLLLEASLYVQKIINDNGGTPPKQINLQGFSRGADACMRMANVLNQLHPDIELNLFLVDQVPGPNRRDDPDSYTIPPNVKNFESILMLHEYRPGFDPQHPGRYVFSAPETTNVSFKIHYGPHWAGLMQTADEKTNHVSRLVHDDLYKFHVNAQSLPENAPVPPPYRYEKKDGVYRYVEKIAPKVLTDLERLDLYCSMKENEWLYAKGTKLNTRTLLSQKDRFIRDPDVFVNQEHRELFKACYPEVFTWFFEKNIAGVEREVVVGELERLNQLFPEFQTRLAHHFKFDLPDIPDPQGVARVETPLMGKPLIQSGELSFLKHSLTFVANYYEYHHPEKSPLYDKIKTDILKTVKACEGLTDPDALRRLQALVSDIKTELENVHDKGFIWQQVNQFDPDIEKYFKEIQQLVDEHCAHNMLMSAEQKNVLQTTFKEIESLKSGDKLSNREKYIQMKENVIQLNANINRPEEETLESLMRQTYFTPILDDQATHSPDSLSQGLNALSNPGLTQTSFSQQLTDRLDAYSKRNTFWKSVQSIFNAIGLPFPAVFSNKKDEIASRLRDQISTLDSKGQGNSPTHIQPFLTEATTQLRDMYASSGKNKISTGTLDKIIKEAEGRINVYQPLAQSSSAATPRRNTP